jgi:hypothetical protein
LDDCLASSNHAWVKSHGIDTAIPASLCDFDLTASLFEFHLKNLPD